jgi:K+-transporting ATPase ATPase C chain
MLDQLRPAVVMIGLMTGLTGLAYPLAVTGVAQVALPAQANASLVEQDGRVVGSALVAQAFTAPHYLHPRPSGVDFNAAASGASNLGPSNAALLETIVQRANTYRTDNVTNRVPIDAVTASGSGLDPHISVENALLQANRVAEARGVPVAEVRTLVNSETQDRWLGLFGERHVNVLLVNLALDAAFPLSPSGAQAVDE